MTLVSLSWFSQIYISDSLKTLKAFFSPSKPKQDWVVKKFEGHSKINIILYFQFPAEQNLSSFSPTHINLTKNALLSPVRKA